MKRNLSILVCLLGALAMGCDGHLDTVHSHAEAAGAGLATTQHGLTAQKNGPHTHDGCQGKINTKRLVYHEMGHVKWNGLDAHQKQVWTEVWKLVIDLGIQPQEPYTDHGKCKNYFEKDAVEGFCVAYSFIKTSETVDSSITNFFSNL